MRKYLLTLAFAGLTIATPALATYTPEVSQPVALKFEQSTAFASETVDKPTEFQQLALADGCADPWWTRSGWQVIAEMIFDVCH